MLAKKEVEETDIGVNAILVTEDGKPVLQRRIIE